MCTVASFLIMGDLTRHVLQDSGVWDGPSSNEYRSGCHNEDLACLSVTGWVFTIFMTYIGFGLLMWGTMWNAHLLKTLGDIRDKWAALRAQSQNGNSNATVYVATDEPPPPAFDPHEFD